MNLASLFRNVIEPLRRRLTLLVSRAFVRSSQDGGSMQTVQASLLRGELRAGVEHFQPYGLAARAKAPSGNAGPEGLYLSVGGDRAHGVVIAVGDRRYRMRSLAEGEVALYDDLGQTVHLKRDGILIKTATRPVTIEASAVTIEAPTITLDGASVHCTGNLLVDGNVIAVGNVGDLNGAKTMAGMRAVYDAHSHFVNNTPGTTDPPLVPM